AMTLARLHRLTAKQFYRERLERLLKAFGQEISEYPGELPLVLAAVDFLGAAGQEVVLVGSQDEPLFQEMNALLQRRFAPNRVVLHRPPGEVGARNGIGLIAPFVAEQKPLPGAEVTVYVCEDYQCRLPVSSVEELSVILSEGEVAREATSGE
ncbi:MAG: hypothetical protein AAF191_18630, partial [Verrucomicrobiota bacterium]